MHDECDILLDKLLRVAGSQEMADIWLQADKPPQVEVFSGLRANLCESSVSTSQMEAIGIRLLGASGWQRVKDFDDFGVSAVFKHVRFGRFYVGSGNGREDWLGKPTLRIRRTAYV